MLKKKKEINHKKKEKPIYGKIIAIHNVLKKKIT